MKVLISDKVNEKALDLFKQNNIAYDYQPEITPQILLKIIPQYEALIVRSRTKVNREIVLAGKNLKIIGRVGSGVDNIDVKTCRKEKITVVNAPDANSQAVAELTLGLLLSLLRKIPQADLSMKKGLWLKKELKGSELSGKTVGIVGYGHVGRRIEKLSEAFGASVLFFSRRRRNCPLQKLFKSADIITIHLPLTPETKGFVNAKLLSLMKPAAFLINTSRGDVVEEKALQKALVEKKISGAALDVYGEEPLPVNSPLRKLENVILTPHIGASTKEALQRATKVVIEDVIRVLKGRKAENRVI